MTIMNGSLGSFEWKEEPLKNPFNAIGHVSDWDGTLRTHKALYALRRFQPDSAGEIARIWIEERNPLKNIEDVEFPMFLEDPALVEFVEANIPPEDAQWKNWHITRWDLTDSVADMWTLSPYLHEAYPTKDQWYQGVNIGKGWQGLLKQVMTILDRYSLSGASLGAKKKGLSELNLQLIVSTIKEKIPEAWDALRRGNRGDYASAMFWVESGVMLVKYHDPDNEALPDLIKELNAITRAQALQEPHRFRKLPEEDRG